MSDSKKIIIDEDWKEEAQREKETLAEAMEAEKKQKQRAPLGEASFAMLLSGLATQAMMALGDMPSPFTGKMEPNLDEAKFHIDLLEILEQKTKGNLTEPEAQMFEGLLYELRMRYVEKRRGQPG